MERASPTGFVRLTWIGRSICSPFSFLEADYLFLQEDLFPLGEHPRLLLEEEEEGFSNLGKTRRSPSSRRRRSPSSGRGGCFLPEARSLLLEEEDPPLEEDFPRPGEDLIFSKESYQIRRALSGCSSVICSVCPAWTPTET